jgi:DNA-binding NtrC family response regulator
MRKNQIIPLELLQRLQFDTRPEDLTKSLGEALNKLFPMPLMEVSWGIKNSPEFDVLCYQKRAGQGGTTLFKRDLNQSLADELISDEEAFVIEDFSDETDEIIEVKKAYYMGAEQLIVLPLRDRLGVNGFLNLYLSEKTEAAYWEPLFNQLCPLLSALFSMQIKLQKTALSSRRAWSQLRDIRSENSGDLLTPFVKDSELMKELWKKLKIISKNLDCFWIQGQTGTGRELLAKHIKNQAGLQSKTMQIFDCSSIPEELHLKEICGDSSGDIGLWNKSQSGCLYIKNHEDLSAAAELRIIEFLNQENRLSTEPKKVIISSNQKPSGQLSEFFSAGLLNMPGFDQRRDDWLWLLQSLVGEISTRMGVASKEITPAFTQHIMQQQWGSDFDKISDFLTKSLIHSNGRTLKIINDTESNVSVKQSKAGRPPSSLTDSVRSQLIKALRKTKGKVYGTDGAAALLGLNPSTLQGKMRKFNLKPADFKSK